MVNWNEDYNNQLTSLYEQGLSFRQIGCEMGISRNAAIGKARRLQLPTRKAEAPLPVAPVHHGRRRRPKRATVKVAEMTKAPVLPDLDYSCEIYALDNATCRWPLWQHDTPHEARRYCGRPSADFNSGQPYCPRHADLCSPERH